jgi:DEAD/DEAH box helicase domain-containing protein
VYILKICSGEVAVSRLEDLIAEWKQSTQFGPYFTADTTLMPRKGDFGPVPEWLDGRLRDSLAKLGIEELYSHQLEAMEATRRKENVVLVTPTASGKTFAYNLPVLHEILADPESRAIYIFPTKALTQDQYTQLYDLIDDMDVPIATHTYDGDTPADARLAIRERGHIVLTNPDMLHSAILPHHTKWMKLFRNLKYVVIDEVHTYRGVFGSHMANVLRRLVRIARFHGSDPTFVCCSATIANPQELAEALVEQPMTLVDRSGAPAGQRHVLLYNPPVVNKQLGIRANYLKQTRLFAMDLVQRDIACIVFALSRLNVELLVKYLREGLHKRGISPEVVQGYRGGYLPNRRREIEKGLREGKVKCVVATNALELGIDIGSLDAAIVAGYPGTQASLTQQWGRAGRKSGMSLAIYVSRSDPLDQYVVAHPDYLLGRNPEEARIDPDNPYILADHLKCAAFELPFEEGDTFGKVPADGVNGLFKVMRHANLVHTVKGRTLWANDAYPASSVSLRNIPGQNFVVIDRHKEIIIAEVDFVSAHTMLHEGAIHNVDGIQYHVKELDYEGRKAYVEQAITDFFTDAETYVEVRIMETEASRRLAAAEVSHGEVVVTEKVVGFKKVRFYTSENVGYGEVNLPELTMHTMGAWFSVSRPVLQRLEYGNVEIADAVMGIARALHFVAALKLMCSVHDLGHCVGDQSAQWFSISGVTFRGSYSFDESGEDAFSPTVFLFDRRSGGVGLAPQAYRVLPELLTRTLELLRDCDCESGCPACIGPASVEVHNPKAIAIELLREMTR